MSDSLHNLSGYQKIKKFLDSTNIHYTATEIYDFFIEHKIESSKGQLFTKSTIRTYLKDLTNDREIQVQDIEGKRDNYYIALTNDEEKYIELEIKGLWLQHWDDTKLLESVKERLSDPNLRYSPVPFGEEASDMYEIKYTEDSETVLMNPESLKNVSFFQGVGMMNFHDISKIVGINPYRRDNTGQHPTGIQRPRKKKWVEELKKGLSKRYSAMLTNSILYFNIETIEEIEPPKKNKDGLIIRNFRIPYKEHLFDYEKTGTILDGQQRMWALDLINLERTFVMGKQALPFYGPVSVIIGDFQNNPDYELEVERMYFITSNETKNLPPTLKQELAAQLDSELKQGLSSKIQFKGMIDRFVNHLDEEEISPFYHEIDHEAKSFNKLAASINNEEGIEIRPFTRKGIYDMINTVIYGNPFDYDDKLEKLMNNFENWIDIMIDYFNAFKCVFYNDWYNIDSFIRRNIGINAIGMLISNVWSHILNSLEREKRIESLIQFFVRWNIFDEDLDFSRNSNFHNFKDLKVNVKKVYDNLHNSWYKSTREPQTEEMNEEIRIAMVNWEKIKDKADQIKTEKLLNIKKE